MDKKMIVEYLNLLVKNRKDEEPYYQLLGEMSLYDTIYNTEVFAAKALGIPENLIDIIMSYSYDGYLYDENYNKLTDAEDVADCIIKWATEENN